jgi:hypothetical protein
MDKDIVKEQLETLTGASVGNNNEINVEELCKEVDKTCKVVNKFLIELKDNAEAHLETLNEISAFLESVIASTEDQELLIQLDKVIDFLFDLQKD